MDLQGRCYDIEPVAGEDKLHLLCCLSLDLFEEGSPTY